MVKILHGCLFEWLKICNAGVIDKHVNLLQFFGNCFVGKSYAVFLLDVASNGSSFSPNFLIFRAF